MACSFALSLAPHSSEHLRYFDFCQAPENVGKQIRAVANQAPWPTIAELYRAATRPLMRPWSGKGEIRIGSKLHDQRDIERARNIEQGLNSYSAILGILQPRNHALCFANFLRKISLIEASAFAQSLDLICDHSRIFDCKYPSR